MHGMNKGVVRPVRIGRKWDDWVGPPEDVIRLACGVVTLECLPA